MIAGFPVVLSLLASAVRADMVVLSSDVRVEGVVVDDSGSDVKLQVSDDGYALFSKSGIIAVLREASDVNEARRRAWARDAADEANAAADEAAYEKAQRDKGLVYFEDEWMTPKEADRRLEQKKLDVEQQKLDQGPPVTNINVEVNAPASGPIGLGEVVGPAHLSGVPLYYQGQDPFAPRPLLNPRRVASPAMFEISR